MSTETPKKTCPRCRSVIEEDAPGGLCPRCLMQFVGMSTGGTNFPSEERTPPNIEAIRAAFPHLEILELIGQGGMGAVYKARQTKLDRIVALKILPERLAREPLFAERFEREGKMLARLSHPNIVGVYDFGQAEGFYFLMMEYVDGVNLRQALSSQQFSPQQALSVIPMICEALQFAHDQGVLHRDIKPENILLDTKGRVKIADFGIAKFAGVNDKTGLTATGATIGTPHYMAPEQIERPADVDHRADIFSLGVVFYEMLTGELPLGRFSAPSERAESLDTRIDLIVMRALEKDRERRQQSANEVRTQVEHLSSHGPVASTDIPSANEPPKLNAAKPLHRFFDRSNVAMALIVASLAIPIGLAMSLRMRGDPSFYLALIAAWLGIPGTLIGLSHLRYLALSGKRTGLLTTVIASTFWPLSIALIAFYGVALRMLEAFHLGNVNQVEPIEVTIVFVVGFVATVLGVRALYKWFKQLPSSTADGQGLLTRDPARLVLPIAAGIVWLCFGLSIILLAPVGTLERVLIALILIGVAVASTWWIKVWIERTIPAPTLVPAPLHPIDKAMRRGLKVMAVVAWLALVLITVNMIPTATEAYIQPQSISPVEDVLNDREYISLDIASLSTSNNVLSIDVMDEHSAPESPAEMDMQLEPDRAPVEGFSPPFQFTIEFIGRELVPEAVIAASESSIKQYVMPGEKFSGSMDLSAGKTATLSFAFPDEKTAQALKLRIERQLHAGQWPVQLPLNGQKKLLLHANTPQGMCEIFVELRQ